MKAKQKKVRCRYCGKLYPRDKCYFGNDPYNEDMHGKKTKTVLCPVCYNASVRDI